MAKLVPSRNAGDPLTGLTNSTLSIIPPEFMGGTTIEEVRQRNPTEATTDDLSATLLHSEIKQNDIGEVWKTNRTLTDPIDGDELTGATLTAEGVPGEIQKTLKLGDQTADADANVIKSTVNPLGGGWTEKVTETGALWTDGVLGQEYDESLNIIRPFAIQVIAAGDFVGNALTEITPKDQLRTTLKTFEIPADAYANYSRSIPISVNLDLPDVLTSLAVTFERDGGSGSYTETAASSGVSWSLTPRGNGSASAAVIPKLLYTIDNAPAKSIPAMQYEFLLANPASNAAILSKLTDLAGGTVLAWPKFKPKALNFVLYAQKMSVEVNANSHANQSDSGQATGVGTGQSVDFSPSLTEVTLPPTIHGAFTLSNTDNSITKTASADASQDGSLGLLTAQIGPIDCVATGTITPTSVAATTVASIPTSGLYLYECRGQNYKHGYLMFVATVVDMANV